MSDHGYAAGGSWSTSARSLRRGSATNQTDAVRRRSSTSRARATRASAAPAGAARSRHALPGPGDRPSQIELFAAVHRENGRGASDRAGCAHVAQHPEGGRLLHGIRLKARHADQKRGRRQHPAIPAAIAAETPRALTPR